MKAWLAIDNGVTGSVAFITDDGRARFCPTPTKSEKNYTKKEGNITRIDGNNLYLWITDCLALCPGGVYLPQDRDRVLVVIERPFINPRMFSTTLSSHRAFEATLVICETLLLPIQYMDSKQWQKEMLPGTKGDDLKTLSLQLGNRKFPQFQTSKMKDRDSLLMAEYCRLNDL